MQGKLSVSFRRVGVMVVGAMAAGAAMFAPSAGAAPHLYATGAGFDRTAVFDLPDSGLPAPVAGSPFDTDGWPLGVTISPDGRFLYQALNSADGVGAYSIDAGGAWAPIKVRAPHSGPFDIIASRSHRNAETDAFIARLPGSRIVAAGSSLKFCTVAEGKADLYPRLGSTSQWDTAAGDAVLRAAGGRVMTLDGNPLRYGPGKGSGAAGFRNPWFVAAGGVDPFA